ncbi:MAG: hypothetical protein JSS65_13465 [Armatimonadetes bacterium]|nr:hypothetical protein [Armatimonadota bacterium]
MKKSADVPAKLVAAVGAALMASGCGSSSYRTCEDRLGMKRPDAECIANGGGLTANPHWVTHRSSTSYGGTGFYGGTSRGGFGTTGSSGSFGGSSSS